MNKERLEQLADHLEKLPPEKFSMDLWCGTTCCIAGHTNLLFNADHDFSDLPSSAASLAQEALGIDHDQGAWLFWAEWEGVRDLTEIPKADAVAAVRHLASGEPLGTFSC